MYIVDIVIAVLLIYGAVRGFSKGFIGQLASLAALLLGIWGAIRFSDFTATFLTQHFNLHTSYISLIAFAITFAAIVIAVHFVGKVVEGIFDMAFLGFINSILGLLFGFLKYAFIISVIIVLTQKINTRFHFYSEEEQNKSIVYKPLSKLAPAVFPYLHFDSIKSTIKEKLNSNES